MIVGNNALDIAILVDNAIRLSWVFERDEGYPTVWARNVDGRIVRFDGELQLIDWLKSLPKWEPRWKAK